MVAGGGGAVHAAGHVAAVHAVHGDELRLRLRLRLQLRLQLGL
jgi:hypothetical protein